MALSRAQDRNQGWRLTGGIRMTFEGDLSWPPGRPCCWCPLTHARPPLGGSSFSASGSSLPVPWWSAPIGDDWPTEGESVRLETLVSVVDPSQPDQQRLAWMTADAVEGHFRELAARHFLGILNRLALELPGEDRLQWIVAEPTPGWHGRARSILQGVLWSSRFITLQLATELDQALLIEYTDRLENPNWQS